MTYCSKCGHKLPEGSLFCPRCGHAVNNECQKTEKENAEDLLINETPTKETCYGKSRQISKAAVCIITTILLIIGYVGYCELKINKARRYYANSEFFKASQAIEYVPVLGREELIRFNTAGIIGFEYEQFLTTKRIRIKKTVLGGLTFDPSNDAYQDCFKELMFGLQMCATGLNIYDLNDIEKDEYKKFMNLYYTELRSMFNISRDEADELVQKMNETKKVDDMKKVCNEWLDNNFFQ